MENRKQSVGKKGKKEMKRKAQKEVQSREEEIKKGKKDGSDKEREKIMCSGDDEDWKEEKE